jgi:hypothetical protein
LPEFHHGGAQSFVSAPTEHGCMGERRWRPSTPWDAQPIPNSLRARVPEHTLSPPVPIVARVEWAVDGEEHIDTAALGWTGQAGRPGRARREANVFSSRDFPHGVGIPGRTRKGQSTSTSSRASRNVSWTSMADSLLFSSRSACGNASKIVRTRRGPRKHHDCVVAGQQAVCI